MPQVRFTAGAAQWPIWRIRFLQRLPQVQVHQAEHHRGDEVPKCGDGDIAERKARRGNLFYGCTNYPKCDFTSNNKPVPEKCPECGSPYLLEKRGWLGSTWSVPITASRPRRTRRPRSEPRRARRPRQRGKPGGLHLLQEDCRAPRGIHRGHALPNQGRSASSRLKPVKPGLIPALPGSGTGRTTASAVIKPQSIVWS